MSRGNDADIKVRFLRALAFEIHRKRPAIEAMADCIEKEGQRGKHRMMRPASAILASEGFVPALKVAGLVGDEASVILSAVAATGDHRLLSTILSQLAEHHEQAAWQG